MSEILYDPIVSELESQYKQINSNLGLRIVAEEENSLFHCKTTMVNKKVLELGCGIYPASCGIKDENMPAEEDYHATDFNENLIKIAKKQDKRIKTSIIDLHKLNEINIQNKYDLILLKGALGVEGKGDSQMLTAPLQSLIFDQSGDGKPFKLSMEELENFFNDNGLDLKRLVGPDFEKSLGDGKSSCVGSNCD